MNRPEHENVEFFVGTEVEHTPAYGKKTLFVIGVQDYHKILEIVWDSRALLDTSQHIEHVYFGANMSFPRLAVNDGAGWAPWETMIHSVLEQNILCTLDIDSTCVEGLLESGLTENHNFIPMISVKLPYINQLGYNATLKIDDKDFAATNPGVWCHSLHDLQKRRVFTDWSKYTQDKVIK
jgi:hypothetical protein